MAINCSNNAALEKLQASKDALNAALNNAATAGRSALGAVDAAVKQLEKDLKAALPELPELPNFKKELQALAGKVGEDLAKAKAAFKERWGDSLPDIDIDGLMNKVSGAISLVENFEDDLEDFVTGAVGLAAGAIGNIASGVADQFDFCKDVPNIEGTVDPDTGKIATVKDLGAEPTPPQEPAKDVEPVVPTVTDAAKAPSKSPFADKSFSEMQETRKEYDDEIAAWHKTNNEILTPEFTKQKKLTKSRDFKKMMKKYNAAVEKGEIKYGSDYYNTIASDSDKNLLGEYFIIRSIVQYTALEGKLFNRINKSYFQACGTGYPLKYSMANVENIFIGTRVEGRVYGEGLPDLPAQVPDLDGASYYQTVVTNGVAERFNVMVDVHAIHYASRQIFNRHKGTLQIYYQYLIS